MVGKVLRTKSLLISQSGSCISFAVAVDVEEVSPVQKRRRMANRPDVGVVQLVSEIMLLLLGEPPVIWVPLDLGFPS